MVNHLLKPEYSQQNNAHFFAGIETSKLKQIIISLSLASHKGLIFHLKGRVQ